MKNMSKLEQWVRAILNEDADKLSIGSVRTLQMIKHEFERLQKENEILKLSIPLFSDKEIEAHSYKWAEEGNGHGVDKYFADCNFKAGAKWMRDKLFSDIQPAPSAQ
jgi:hypothetical protein